MCSQHSVSAGATNQTQGEHTKEEFPPLTAGFMWPPEQLSSFPIPPSHPPPPHFFFRVLHISFLTVVAFLLLLLDFFKWFPAGEVGPGKGQQHPSDAGCQGFQDDAPGLLPLLSWAWLCVYSAALPMAEESMTQCGRKACWAMEQQISRRIFSGWALSYMEKRESPLHRAEQLPLGESALLCTEGCVVPQQTPRLLPCAFPQL